jgi:predicted phage terminase large subunit-like protein
MNKDIVLANYQQEPIDVKGRLYTNINTFTELPTDASGHVLFDYILNYTDTADTGSDYLCSICYGVYSGTMYILDVLYTQKAMEYTEPETARMLTHNNVGTALIESNNGGRGFARNVEKEMRQMGNTHTAVRWFHQTQNKTSRILSNSTSVMNNVLFPVNWQDRWPQFAEDIMKYQREGKNAHDDCADALTGVYENQKPRNTAQVKTFKGGI